MSGGHTRFLREASARFTEDCPPSLIFILVVLLLAIAAWGLLTEKVGLL